MAFDGSGSTTTNKIGLADKQVIKQGYIEKRGAAMLSAWKTRYIVLYNNSSIDYYTDDSKQTLQGTIHLLPSNLSNKCKNDPQNVHEVVHCNLNNVKHGFDIECKNRTWKFPCKNDKIKQDWIVAIRLCIKQELEKIKPSKNNVAKCTEEYDNGCPDVYHCCFELHVKYDEWIVVWPLISLKLHDKSNYNDEKKSDENNAITKFDTNDKMVYLFDNKEDRDNESFGQAIKIWDIPSGFDNIYEYFPFHNKPEKAFKSQYYCMIQASQDRQYVFKCKNSKQRRLFIDAICEKIYYQDDDIDKTYQLTTRNNNKFVFKYKPIHYHIKHHYQENLNKWFHVPVSVQWYDYKFLL